MEYKNFKLVQKIFIVLLIFSALNVSAVELNGNELNSVELNGVPANIKEVLQIIADNDSNIHFRYGVNGSITLETPDSTQTYYPLLLDPTIDQEFIGSEFQYNPDGSISFGSLGKVEITYAPLIQEAFSYPTFPDELIVVPGMEIPENIVLPPGFIVPECIKYSNESIPPLVISSFFELNGITNIQYSNEGNITINEQQFKPFYGLVSELGKPQPGVNSRIQILDNGTVYLPDGTLLIPYILDLISNDPIFLPNALPVENADGSNTLLAGSFPEDVPLPADTIKNADESVTVAASSIISEKSLIPVFLGAIENSDGTYILSDGTIVLAPPIITNGFKLNLLTGMPVDKDGNALQFDISGLPIDPETGLVFIPGKQEAVDLNSISFDSESGFPIDEETGLAIDPFTGQIYSSQYGFRPAPAESVFVLPSSSSIIICAPDSEEQSSICENNDDLLDIDDSLFLENKSEIQYFNI